METLKIIVYWFGFLLLWTFWEPLYWIWNFSIFISHKLSRPTPPHQVVNGEWMTTSTVTKSPKSESETRKRESGVLLPTFKTSRDNDDFKNNSGSSRFCPPLLLHRPQVPPYWGQKTSSIKPQTSSWAGAPPPPPGLEDDEQWCCSCPPRHWSSRPCGWVPPGIKKTKVFYSWADHTVFLVQNHYF